MSTFKLDGNDISFEPGDTIIRAAWRAGIEIPHYCWHPGLSVAANCRMCLVEVTSGKPMQMPVLRWDEATKAFVPSTKVKLQPACQTPAAEGLEVSAQSPAVKTTQASVQEFLLLNHPVDCPICDQAGECRLQDYWTDHQHTLKRKDTEPVHKPKAVRFGPTIVYDAERCIMCTRCIRVCDEVVGDHVLDMRERGNRNEIVVAPGRELDHRYTLMTEHVCPVGALTSRDFRFKARVWFLKSAPSVCSGCATGCNSYVDYDPRVQKVYRLRPRDNEKVNRHWMCDDGMMTYRQIHEGRVRHAAVGWLEARRLASQAEALALAAAELQRCGPSQVGFVLSAQHCSEDNFVLAQLGEQWGVSRFYLAANGGWEGDKILRNADNNPNRLGATQAVAQHITVGSIDDLCRDVSRGALRGVVVLGQAAAHSVSELEALRSLAVVVALTSNEGVWSETASVLIPVTSWAEMEGSYVNVQGMVQNFRRAISPPEGLKPAWRMLGELGTLLQRPCGYEDLAKLRAAMRSAQEEWGDVTQPQRLTDSANFMPGHGGQGRVSHPPPPSAEASAAGTAVGDRARRNTNTSVG